MVKCLKLVCLCVVKMIFSEDWLVMWCDARDFYGGDGVGFVVVSTKLFKRVDV